MIDISGLDKTYGRQRVLNEIDLQIPKGRSVAMIGPNGSGKTTLIKVILRLVMPDAGRVMINGMDITAGCDYRSHIGYMPQMSRLPEHMSVSRLFEMMSHSRQGRSAAELDKELYHAFDIDSMADKALGALSGGMRQKVGAALAFLFDPAILILDEPTAALDPLANEALKTKIRKTNEEGRNVLITSHNLSDLDGLVERVIYLMDGHIHFDHTIDEMRALTDKDSLDKMVVALLAPRSTAS